MISRVSKINKNINFAHGERRLARTLLSIKAARRSDVRPGSGRRGDGGRGYHEFIEFINTCDTISNGSKQIPTSSKTRVVKSRGSPSGNDKAKGKKERALNL